jgi:hypothetical protein
VIATSFRIGFLSAVILVVPACKGRTAENNARPGGAVAGNGGAASENGGTPVQVGGTSSGVGAGVSATGGTNASSTGGTSPADACAPACDAATGPHKVAPECKGAWVATALPEPWWISAGATAACSAALTHSPPEAYDDCTPTPYSDPYQCGMPISGASFCHQGRWTASCTQNSECPRTMVCVDSETDQILSQASGRRGRCEKACTGTGATECIRCGMACDRSLGYCLPTDTRKPCRSQCECGWGAGCYGGRCTFMGDQPNPYDFCAPSGSSVPVSNGKCACRGGQCRATDGCCVLPDGTVENSLDPACAP